MLFRRFCLFLLLILLTVRVFSEDYQSLFRDGLSKCNAGEYREAIGLFTQVIEIKPDYYNGYLERGICYKNLSRYDSAIADFTQALKIVPGDTAAYVQRADCLMSAGKFQAALNDYLILLKQHPDDETFLYSAALAYNSLKDYKEALFYLNRLINLPARQNKPVAAELLLLRGNLYYNNKEWDKAEKDLQKIIQAEPGEGEAYLILGRVYKAQEKYQDAIKMFNRALKTDPEYFTAYRELGLLYQQLGQYREAVDAFTEAIKYSYGMTRELFLYRSQVYRAMGEKEKADADYAAYLK